MHSGCTLALSTSLVCLRMQNFAPVSGLALDPYSSNASLGFPYSAQNSWPQAPSGLEATTGPYQQHDLHQPHRQSWNVTHPNSTYFQPLIQLPQNQHHQFNYTNLTTAPNYQAQQGSSPLTNHTWQQPVGFVAVPGAALASFARVFPVGVAPFALPDTIKAPLAPQLSFASVAKSDNSKAISGSGRATKTLFSVSLDAEQAIRLVKRATRWQDPDYLVGVMIAKDGEQLTPKCCRKLFPYLQS